VNEEAIRTGHAVGEGSPLLPLDVASLFISHLDSLILTLPSWLYGRQLFLRIYLTTLNYGSYCCDNAAQADQ